MTKRTPARRMDMLLAVAELRNGGRKGSGQRDLAVDTPVIGSAELCWCGKPYGHEHPERNR